MNQRILVIGAEGRLGEPVARRLLADGYQVRVLTRNPDRARRKFGPQFEVVPGDVQDSDSIREALNGCDGVHVNLAGGPSPADFDRIEHRGTALVARLAAELGVKRLTYLSGAPAVAENRRDPGSLAKFRAEEAIRDSGAPYTIFKATWMMEALPMFVRGTRALVIGAQSHPIRWIAADDFARMVSGAFSTPQAAGKTFFTFGPDALTKRQALRVYLDAGRSTVKLTRVPLWIMKIVAFFSFNVELRSDVARMAFYDTIGDDFGDGSESNMILARSTTTLREWSEAL